MRDIKALRAKSLYLTAPEQLQWLDEDLPPLGPQEVLLQTCAGSISIGSEIPLYTGTARSIDVPRYPRMTGYESLGTVQACGEQVSHLRIGDRCVAFYGHRTYCIVPAAQVLAVPEGISDALALLAILTCDVAKGVRKVAPRPEEPVLITGAGAIGLLALFILKAYGVATVDVLEPRLERHELALALGARHVMLSQALSSTTENYAAAFECSSRNAAFTTMQNNMRPHGRICILADGNYEPFTLAPTFHTKELQIVGSSDGWDYHAHAAWYFQVLQRPTPLEGLFQLQISSNELISTFAQLASGGIHPTKVMVHYE